MVTLGVGPNHTKELFPALLANNCVIIALLPKGIAHSHIKKLKQPLLDLSPTR